ncbi:MAG: helix-turn-helix domain-containing protein [Methanomassiliicoccales archaeon]
MEEQEISKFIADEYSAKILSATYRYPMSVQEISSRCDIPIAVAYRRVGDMENAGLLKCVKQSEVYRGKKVRYFSCAVKNVQYSFDRGSFYIDVDWMPEEEMEISWDNE